MVLIEWWHETHCRWPELVSFVNERETSAYIFHDEDAAPFYAAVALAADAIVGYHVILVQPIGPEMDVPPLTDRAGTILAEAKVRALRVNDAYRGQGIGTRLQETSLKEAQALGCFQMRSRSAIDKVENYQIKIKLGFACHPSRRTFKDGTFADGVYWVKRLN